MARLHVGNKNDGDGDDDDDDLMTIAKIFQATDRRNLIFYNGYVQV